MAYSSYYTYQKFVTYHEQDPLPVLPKTYSVDGEGTLPLRLKEACDINCGCTGETTPIYRWININPSIDWVCDICEIQSKWVESGTVCDGTTLRKRLVKYYSYDGGTTWVISDPIETMMGEIIETESSECGHEDWGDYKYIGIYNGDITNPYLVEYNGSNIVSSTETQPFGKNIGELTRIIIGSAVTSIAQYAFAGAENLSDTGTFPPTLTDIGEAAFTACTSLVEMTLNEGLETLGGGAFGGCSGLTNITFPTTVITLGAALFYQCSNLATLTFKGTTPPYVTRALFDDLPNNYVIFVPASALNTYKTSWDWCSSHIQAIS